MNNSNGQEQIKHAIASEPIDRILASEDPILPSTGFLASVMERIQEESRLPAPITFPWKRAVPGILLATGVFGWGAFEFIRVGIPAAGNLTFPVLRLSSATDPMEQATWVGLALAISLASWLLSRRISGLS